MQVNHCAIVPVGRQGGSVKIYDGRKTVDNKRLDGITKRLDALISILQPKKAEADARRLITEIEAIGASARTTEAATLRQPAPGPAEFASLLRQESPEYDAYSSAQDLARAYEAETREAGRKMQEQFRPKCLDSRTPLRSHR